MGDRRGVFYMFALGTMVMLTILTASGLLRTAHDVQSSERSRSQQSALHLADAGIDQAMINLRTADVGDDILIAILPSGQFALTVDLPSGDNQLVTSQGTAASEQRRVEAVIHRVARSIFEFALFGDQAVNVTGNAISDSYDSGAGTYDPDNHGHNGDVGTNAVTAGGIEIGGSIFIDGQLAVGAGVEDPAAVVTVGGCTDAPADCIAPYVTGGTSPPSDSQDVVAQSAPFPMPPVVVPDGLTCGDLTLNSGTTTLSPTGGVLGNGTYCYHNLTVEGGAALTASGSVTVYLTGELKARGNSIIGDSSDPTRVVIKITSSGEATLEQGTITGSTEFYGAIYAPDATINISGNADIFGSVIAKQVDVTGSARIHYDEAMTARTDVSNRFATSVVSWRELP